jgi:predicted AlkP superfamily phosphohydrolase/phosphomutase
MRLSTNPDYGRAAVIPGSLYSGLLYFNVADREMGGVIPANERSELAARLKDELSKIQEPDTGEPLFANIFSAADLYCGPAAEHAPDLILDAYRSQWNIRTLQPAPHKGKQHSRYFITFDQHGDFGWHSPEGVFVFSGPAFRRGRAADDRLLMDVPATLLHIYDVPLPEDWDGHVLLDLLTPELSRRPIRTQPGDEGLIAFSEDVYSLDEAESLRSHLRALGYLD